MRVAFDRFTFDSERRELDDGSSQIHLGPKAFRLLELLIENAPRALSKRELYQQLWPDTFVDETNLAGLINEVREALGDAARKPRFIRTVHGFGYAFSGEVARDDSTARAIVVFRGKEIPLRDGANVLGRDASADVQIDDVTVSRRHAKITLREDGATLDDLASKNGTFIDGKKISDTTPLTDHQTFVLGDASITFKRAGSAGSTVTVSQRRS